MTSPSRPSAEQPDTRWVAPALGAVYLIWGSTYLAMRVAVAGLPPFYMASTRFLLTGLVLLVFLRLRGAPWPTAKEWLWSAPVGALMFALGNGTVAMAERHISSGVAAVVCGTMPLWAAAMGPFFGERTTAREWVGMVLGLTGVAVLGLGSELRGDPVATVALMVAPIAWALGSLLARKMPLPKGLMSAATQMLTGGAIMTVVSRVAGEPWPTLSEVPASALVAWAYLAVAGSLVAYSAYTYLLRTTRPAVATSYSYVNPAIAVAVGVALGNERVGPEIVLSVGLVVMATLLVVLQRSRGAGLTPSKRG